MKITGTVEKVVRRRTDYGSTYLAVTIDGRRWKYLHTFQPMPTKGDKVTLEGMAMIGFPRVNIGGVRVTIDQAAKGKG